MRKIECPFLEGDTFIALPDKWLGLHASRRDEIIDQAREKKFSDTQARFAISMALLEDWSLPGLSGNPEKWDFAQLDLSIIAWVIGEVLPDFFLCLNAPAVYSKRSGAGPGTSETTEKSLAGSSETAE